jgi:hypothetical protein
MLRQSAFKSALVLGGLMLAGFAALSPSPAQARVFVGFGIGAPFYYPAPYWYGPPVVYAPPPVVYTQPAPQITYTQPAPQYWYYCDAAKGYYPYVNACPAGWRQVQPTQAAPAAQ